jgi:predicted DCC family thiol-disulfide oxidoreductase YuxK
MEKNIVYFDGVCGLCNKFIDFLIRFDKRNKLLFAPLQGETRSKKSNAEYSDYMNTVIFDRNGKLYYKSEASIRIIYSLGGFWRVVIILLLIPSFLRNPVYDFIARRRYNWFGQKESCRIPTEEEKTRFLP